MELIQMVSDVPEWARKHGLDRASFDVLEQIVLNPDRENEILMETDYDIRCCLRQSLSYGRSKGLL